MHLNLFAKSLEQTPQTEPLIGKKQVKNSAGGYCFQVTPLQRIRRWLILGSAGGTYYASEKQLTATNAKFVVDIFTETDMDMALKVIELAVDVSVNNLAAKNDTAIFALSLAIVFSKSLEVRKSAWDAIKKVCRIPTHLFALVEFNKTLRSSTGNFKSAPWGKVPKDAIGKWYNEQDPLKLAYAVTKYKNRNNWTHVDVLRLAHVNPKDSELHGLIYKYIVKGWDNIKPETDFVDISVQDPMDIDMMESKKGRLFNFLNAVEKTLKCEYLPENEVAELIKDNRLAREHLNTKHLKSHKVWKALLEDMPMTAMMRSLGQMTAATVLTCDQECSETKTVVNKFKNESLLKKARLHPFNILVALMQYKAGKGLKGSLCWLPVPEITKSLDAAFYLSFQNVEPTNKRYLVGLDVSGSMCAAIQNTNISCAEAAAAMLMVLLKTEPSCLVMAFAKTFKKLDVTAKDSLEKVIEKTKNLTFGSTDCSLPMTYALKYGLKVDVFVVYTDNETYFGKLHPMEALRMYRKKMGIDAKLIVVGMTATNFTIADGDDGGCLDVVGFDASAPQIINNFVNELGFCGFVFDPHNCYRLHFNATHVGISGDHVTLRIYLSHFLSKTKLSTSILELKCCDSDLPSTSASTAPKSAQTLLLQPTTIFTSKMSPEQPICLPSLSPVQKDDEPLSVLPKQFAPLESLLQRMPLKLENGKPGLLAEGKFGDAVLKELPVIEVDSITDNSLLTGKSSDFKKNKKNLLALFRDYTFAASAYLLEPCDLNIRATGKYGLGREILPKQLAIPLSKIAEKIGAKPFMEYAMSYSLYNWKRTAPGAPMIFPNLRLIRSFQNSPSETGFILVHVAMVAYSGHVVDSTLKVLESAETNDRSMFDKGLGSLLGAMKKINQVMETMWKRSAPSDYKEFRTFIMGTKNQPMFPNGVIYEGVSKEPTFFRGESGANDSIIPTCDNLLQLTDRMPNNPMTAILKDFRTYRPSDHNQWLTFVEKRAVELDIRSFALGSQESSALYLAALDQIREFRDRHWRFTKEYILKHSGHPVATGGSPIIGWLPNQLAAALDAMKDVHTHIYKNGIPNGSVTIYDAKLEGEEFTAKDVQQVNTKQLIDECGDRAVVQRRVLAREVEELGKKLGQNALLPELKR
ncbi:60 kDa SS-A/Ro ribonucleoprotein [Lobulomyces angularis]|nr:60 kDa SS-A/Ro ribonucleoprotein [Lobulomyces angularis]